MLNERNLLAGKTKFSLAITNWVLRLALTGASCCLVIFGAAFFISSLIQPSSAVGFVSMATIETSSGVDVDVALFSIHANATTTSFSDSTTLKAHTNNPGGFTFSIGSASGKTNQLTYFDSSTSTDAFTSDFADGVSALPDSTWGFTTDSGSSFKSIPDSTQGSYTPSTVFTSSAAGEQTQSFKLAAKASASMPIGVYEGAITFSSTPNVAPIRYTLTYLDVDKSDGGTSRLAVDSAYESSSSHNFTANSSATKTGKVLIGWATSASDALSYRAGVTTIIAPGATIAVSSDIPYATYYAVWRDGCGSTMTMQSISAAYVSGMATNAQVQMCDERDGKLYWVSKLADGNVWMTQSLDLDLSTSTPLTSSDSDVTSSWTPQNNTKTASAGSWSSSYSSAYSYDPGSQYLADGTASSGTAITCTASNNGGENCHYHQGNYYNWYAATAGSDASTMSSDDGAPQSICPKGWQLPYGTLANKSWYYLVNQAGITASNVTVSPFYIPRAGLFIGSIYAVGISGFYWSSTVASSGSVWLFYANSSHVSPMDGYSAGNGNSIRCVAR